MANTPKKMKDPTEAALSAIQDALQIRDEPAQPDTASTPAPAPASEEKPWPGLRSKLSNKESAKPAPAPYEEERAGDPMPHCARLSRWAAAVQADTVERHVAQRLIDGRDHLLDEFDKR